jgi:shikimate dehydrogenase
MILSGSARLAGVIGWPVAHSRSPRLHGYWLERYKIDGAYVPLAVQPSQVAQALRMLGVMGFRGVNVTVPHKEAALAAVDVIEPVARRIGAINTITMEADGSLRGSNTDGAGFLAHLRASAPGWTVAGAVVVVGAGGAARAIVAALADAGVPEIRVVNRTRERAEELARSRDGSTDGSIKVMPWIARDGALDGASLVVNTTTLGMTGQPPLDINLRCPASLVVADIVYNPLVTKLLAMARERGLRTADGLGMLLQQAVRGFELWFGIRPEVTLELRAMVEADLMQHAAPIQPEKPARPDRPLKPKSPRNKPRG